MANHVQFQTFTLCSVASWARQGLHLESLVMFRHCIKLGVSRLTHVWRY